MVVSAPSHDWLLCCERKKLSTGYEMWLSSSSADQRSQSRSTSSITIWSIAGPSVFPASRTRSSAADGGDPARESSMEI